MSKPLFFASRSLVLLLGTILATSLPAKAGLVWDNGAPIKPGRNISSLISADDFNLSTSTNLTSLRFWAQDFDSSTGFTSFDGTISWSFYSNNGGIPGSVLKSGFDSAPAVSLYSPNGIYQLDVNLGSVSLGPGTYWIALHEGLPGSPDDGSDIYWERSVIQQGNSLKSDSNLQNPSTWNAAPSPDDLAFQLTGTAAAAVPEPSSLALCGMAGGIALAAAWGRRRRSA